MREPSILQSRAKRETDTSATTETAADELCPTTPANAPDASNASRTAPLRSCDGAAANLLYGSCASDPSARIT